MATSAFGGPACGGQGRRELPAAPWSVRVSRANAARPAMEVYAAGTLLGVVVATPLSPGLLSGARRTVWAGQHRAIAWGRVVGSRSGIAVRFSRGRPGRAEHAAEVIGVTEWFWVALADGRFAAVTATYQGIAEKLRVPPARTS
jgi:hypothetical protein